MHKRNVIAILLTAVVFIAAAVLGVYSVYRVDAVTLNVSVVSAVAREEADALQKNLLARYEDESIFSVDEGAAEEEFAAFPYFRMISFRRQYPNRLVIEATEDAEMFAVERGEDSYYILGADGTVLGIRSDVANRSDGADNVVVTGLSAAGERGEILGGDECIPALLALCKEADALFGGLRSNLVSVEVSKPTSSYEDISFCLTMREGVKAYIRNPLTLTREKAAAFAAFYIGLEADERLGGRIEVTDDALEPGQVRVSYLRNG